MDFNLNTTVSLTISLINATMSFIPTGNKQLFLGQFQYFLGITHLAAPSAMGVLLASSTVASCPLE